MAERKGISGSTLKLIAIGAMFIDHFAAIVLTRYLVAAGIGRILSQEALMAAPENRGLMLLYLLELVMRLIGRLGFPIFCFLLLEGFHYTKSRAKYAARLGAFALISEVPFDFGFRYSTLAANHQLLEFGYQNVFFTLFIGLLTVWGLDALANFFSDRIETAKAAVKMKAAGTETLRFLGTAAITAAGMAAAQLLKTDYAATGVGTIVIMYLAKKNNRSFLIMMCAVSSVCLFLDSGGDLALWAVGCRCLLLIVLLFAFLTTAKSPGNGRAAAAGCGVLTIAMLQEFTAFATVPLAAAYNGKRGWRLKYVFYLFYPLHILLLHAICIWTGIS